MKASENNWSPDNPYNGTDDEEAGDFWESYMGGYYSLKQ